MKIASINDWKNNPIELYEQLINERNNFILMDFPHNRFPIAIPLVEETIDNILILLEQNEAKTNERFILNGVEELTQEFTPQIREILDDITHLKTGKIIKSLNNDKEITVRYPYLDTLECTIKYAALSEQIHRYKFYKNLLAELENNHPHYLDQDVNDLRSILNSSKSTAEKLDDLITWDKASTTKKLQRENRPHDIFHVNKAMHIPGYYQRQYKKLVMEDLVHADSIDDAVIIPTFSPLDIEFFNKTRVAPVYVMGLLDFAFIFADGYRHTCHEFAFHDLKHAWDMELFRIKSAADHNQSLNESMVEQQRIANYIFYRISQVAHPKMQECLEFLLFELVHEEGHSYNLNDLKDGLDEPNIFCNDLLGRLTTQKLLTGFFSENKKYFDYIPLFQRGKNMLIEMIDDAFLELDIPRERNAVYITNHHGVCEGRTVEKIKTKENETSSTPESKERMITPNISLKHNAL